MLANKALSSAPSAEPVFVESVFSTYLYTGNGSTQTITNGIDLAGKGGLVWAKKRGAADDHALFDTERGDRVLSSNLTDAQSPDGTRITYQATGFQWDAGGGTYNQNTSTYVSWTFRKAPKFFDVVTYTGNGANRTIAHNLGSIPGCIIVKRTDGSADWQVYHRSSGNTKYLVLNSTAAEATSSTRWNDTTPTSTVFSVGTESTVNANGGTYVAYLFAHDAGGFGDSGNESVIKCGTFSGTGFVDLGWEPQWLLIKPYNQTWNWEVYDNMRGMGQPAGSSSARSLIPNLSNAEANGSSVSFEATGFTQTTFGSSYPCIYIAIRRGPMKVPTSGTSVFYSQSVSQTDTPDSTGVPFAPDLVSTFSRNGSERSANFNVFQVADRLRGLGTPNNSYSSSTEGRSLVTSSTGGEISATIPNGQSYIQLKADGINITRGGGWNSSAYGNWIYYFMQRAPGFFDVVCYTGTGSARTVAHNLTVAPELMIGKNRTNPVKWSVYSSAVGNTAALALNLTDIPETGSWYWNNTSPTSSVFTLGNSGLNLNGDSFVMYLFATCPGVSKVGSYTGTGTTKQIDCGFTGGARFVLIKRTDSTGDWYVWDSARGIVAGNDPYLLLNSSATEVTNTDYIDTYSAGFEISSTAPAAINANGGTFIFLAIA